MQNFYGSYKNVLDAKGRINMPARFREMDEKSGNGEHMFVVARGTDQCVSLYQLSEWQRKNEGIVQSEYDGKVKRRMIRSLNYYASHQKIDKQGRINIPSHLIEYAELEKDVVVIGTDNHIEVWNPKFLEMDLEVSEREDQDHFDKLDS